MEGGNKSQASASASAELTSGQDVEDLQGKLSEIEKALAEAVGRRAQLERLWTSVLEKLRPLRDRVASAKIASAIVASARGACRSFPNEGEARSVFLVVSFTGGKYSGALYEVKFNKKGEYVGGGGVSNEPQPLEPPLLEPVANLTGGYIIRGARIFNRAKLYLLPEETIDEIFELENPKSLDGFMFDTSAGSLLPLKPPKGPRPFGALVSAYGKLYYLASPKCDSSLPEPFFEMYDPSIDRWDEVPCSYPFICECWAEYWDDLDIVGYVVCYGFILFSMCDLNQSRAQVMAFDVSTNKWHQVEVDGIPFQGRGVVVGKTIYALSSMGIMAFTVKMDEGDEGCTACSLSKPLILPGLEIIDWPFKYGLTEYLVHLGNHDFCHVQTGEQKNCTDRQYICITMFQIVVGEGGSHIKTLNSTICAVDVKDSISFSLNFSFSPENDDFEPEDERMIAMKQEKSQVEKSQESHEGKSQA
ncbi:unnamed protein product [Prunus armeniaca]|uniref:Uncharacterized protein n=1 Tax=Prunus armeniaca TaxID=36596 RepID=A0A6J5UY55_PRUAR|nr:unnamed protein product [Prunus armeniaca]CAB4311262.1 unnamed protein product [Prunus armeniaca]